MTLISSQDTDVNSHESLKTKICVIIGLYNFDFGKISNFYQNYLSNWYYIYNDYSLEKVHAACVFFITLDILDFGNLMWYRPNDFRIKPFLHKILYWWNWRAQHKLEEITWNLFLGRFFTLYVRACWGLRKW
jgi:hypothetical protein